MRHNRIRTRTQLNINALKISKDGVKMKPALGVGFKNWSGKQDSNLRPPGPKPGA